MTKGFAQIPNEVLTDPNLSAAEKVVYGIILGKFKLKGYCFVGNESLAKATGNTERHIRRILNSLLKKEYIEIKLDYTKKVTERQITPLVVVEKQEDIYVQTRRTCMSSNNTSSLKEKKTKKKFNNFSSLETPTRLQGTETLRDDIIFRATNGLYDGSTLVQECKFRWPEVPPEKTELYQKVLEKIK